MITYQFEITHGRINVEFGAKHPIMPQLSLTNIFFQVCTMGLNQGMMISSWPDFFPRSMTNSQFGKKQKQQRKATLCHHHHHRRCRCRRRCQLHFCVCEKSARLVETKIHVGFVPQNSKSFCANNGLLRDFCAIMSVAVIIRFPRTCKEIYPKITVFP